MAAANSLPSSSHREGALQPSSDAARSQFLTTDEAASFLRLSPRTLEKQRVIGGGPRFRKFGARVVYAAADLCAWADKRSYEMTSDPGYAQRDSVR